MIENYQRQITSQLSEILEKHVSDNELRQVLAHSLIPPGKLFRPLLILTLAQDLGEITDSHYLFACAIEIHHCYTLIHDDLPAMDDDDFRRGKPSSHKQFNEWTAILAGDALMGLSYELLSEIEPTRKLLKLFGQYTGANGLILGQITDMKAQSTNLQEVVRIHELKTSALMQLSLEGSGIISGKDEIQVSLCEIGRVIGVNFQLLDDLCELTETVQGHELKANPFLAFSKDEILDLIRKNTEELFSLLEKHKLHNLKNYYLTYQNIINKKLANSHETVTSQTGLTPESWAFLNDYQ